MKNRFESNNIKHLSIVVFILFIAINFISNDSLALGNPIAYISEEVTYYYYANGTVSYTLPPIGYVDVWVPNTVDVLQYLKLDLSESGITYTNILSNTAYASVAASPTVNDKTRMMLNTDNDPKDVSYTIDDLNIVPIIGLSFESKNLAGGNDLFAGGTNTLQYKIYVDSTKSLDNVTLSFKLPTNNYELNDAAHLYSPTVAEGIISVFDSDGDGVDESLSWQGDLTPTGINLYVYANTTPGVNFDRTLYYLDLMCVDCVDAIGYSTTFTGLSFLNLFSRGPIHNGIYIIFRNETYVRGFMKNIANDLKYAVDGWRLYNITDFENSLLESHDPFVLNPSEMYNTEFYQTNDASEKYFTVAFDWGVVWDFPIYLGTTQSFMDLPKIYESDISLGKSSTHKSSEKNISVVVTGTYMGNENLDINSISFNTSIPYKSTGGTTHKWESIEWSDISAEYINSSGDSTLINLTEDMIVIKAPTQTDNGYIYLNIDNISNNTGSYLKLNNDIKLIYNLYTTPINLQNSFDIKTTVIAKTMSGTPVSKIISEYIILYGVDEVIVAEPIDSGGSSGSGGGLPPVTKSVMELVKYSMGLNFIDSNTVDVSGTYKLIDPNNVGTNNLTVLLNIPKTSLLFNPQSIVIKRYDSTLNRWVDLSDKNIKLSEVDSSDFNKTFYSFNLNTFGLTRSSPILGDSDLLKINYVLTLPYGTYDLIMRTQVSDETMTNSNILKPTDIHIPLRIVNDANQLESIVINESPFNSDDIYVGIPPVWSKIISAYNPNSYSMSHRFEIQILSDFLNINLLDGNTPVNSSIKKINNRIFTVWNDIFNGNETKTYELNVTTAPVIRILENHTVLDATTADSVLMLTTITLYNPGGVDYENVTFIYSKDLDIINVSDNFGNILDFNIIDDEIKIIVPIIKNNSSRYINIIYTAYSDILEVSLDKLGYVKDNTKYNILYVPLNDENKISFSVEVLGPTFSDSFTTVYADVMVLENISSQKEVNIYDTLRFNPLSSGAYTILVRAYSQNKFVGEGSETFFVELESIDGVYGINLKIVLIIVILIILLILLRIYKKKGFNDNLGDMKKQIKNI